MRQNSPDLVFMAASTAPHRAAVTSWPWPAKIYLIDDGNAAVALPEVPLLGVLPGTGGLTRLTDKRKIRRDMSDVFCTKPKDSGLRMP